jgi:2-alkyl-3-oxoalkanoate reductase
VVARAARDAGARRLVHLSTAGVYDRSPGAGDVSEDSPLVGEDGGDYPVTKRDTDRALAEVGGLTTVLVRPPAILGSGETSVWNALRPAAVRDGERDANPDKSFAWVHVDDLADLVADVATGAVPTADNAEHGPVAGGTTAVIVAGEAATWRDYHGTVCEALGVEPGWSDEPVWQGSLLTDRAVRWGWSPRVGLAGALEELRRDVRALA